MQYQLELEWEGGLLLADLEIEGEKCGAEPDVGITRWYFEDVEAHIYEVTNEDGDTYVEEEIPLNWRAAINKWVERNEDELALQLADSVW